MTQSVPKLINLFTFTWRQQETKNLQVLLTFHSFIHYWPLKLWTLITSLLGDYHMCWNFSTLKKSFSKLCLKLFWLIVMLKIIKVTKHFFLNNTIVHHTRSSCLLSQLRCCEFHGKIIPTTTSYFMIPHIFHARSL